ncbi:MAG: ABC transporter ATP-binding protein [Actinomycetaceae bacterium]|nr:ABC transporter ATP-binding protein [Actinomycetaceae bacterium]
MSVVGEEKVDGNGNVRFLDVSLTMGGKVIIDRANMPFVSGDVYVVYGPSGVGKTSLLNMIAGYLRPQSGVVDVRGTVGYLLQDDVLFSRLSALDNVVIAGGGHGVKNIDDVKRRARILLGDVGLGDKGDVLVEFLSGGERQRVRLACVLIEDPDIVLCDEPTTGVDVQRAHEILKLLKTMCAGKTLIVVTHDLLVKEVFSQSHVLQLGDGVLREETV